MRWTRLSTAALPVLLVALVLLATGPGPSRAEDDPPSRILPFAVRDTNAARFALRESERLLAAGRTDQGLATLQRLLDDLSGDFVLVSATPLSLQWRLAAEEARDLLARLSPDARRAYERLAAPSAGPMLERAVQFQDVAALRQVVERFGASRAGLGAARVLADLALEAGNPHDAAHFAREGLRFAPEDPGLWLRLLDGLGAAGDRAALEALTPPAHLAGTFDGARRALSERREALLGRTPAAEAAADWPLWGGSASRDRPALPGSAAKAEPLRWTHPLPLPTRRLDRTPIRGFGEDTDTEFWRRWESFRPLHPVAEGRVVYVADGRGVHGIDLYSGRAIWSFGPDSESPLALAAPGEFGEGRTNLERVFAPVLWRDLVIATVEVLQPYLREELQQVEISTYLPQRTLVALDRETGRLRWSMGADGAARLLLPGFSISSPCVVADGIVVALASRYDGSHTVAFVGLDAATGRMRWHRTLGVGQQELNLFGAPVKELATGTPAVRDGVAFAASGLGFVAAVEIRTGRPLWLASHEIVPIEPVQFWFKAPLRFPRVAASPAVVQGDLVLVAPTDGLHLHAFDRRSGALRWRVAYPRTPLGATAEFLGVADDGRRGVALLTGQDLEAYDLASGRRAWVGRLRDEVEAANQPVGRGVVWGEEVLVPTERGLVRFSLPREGSFLGREPWPAGAEPGNLLPLPRVLLVASREAVQAFYSWAEIERDLERRRVAHAGDPEILLEAGEIYRLGGALERAEAAFREAREMAVSAGDHGATRRATQGLHLTALSAAEARPGRDVDRALAAYRRALEWAQTPAERVDVRVRMDALLAGRPAERVENLERLAEEAEGVRAAFAGSHEVAPARAMALLRLAQVELDRERPREAVSALQRLIREEGEERLGDQTARQRAKAVLDEVLATFGRAAYQHHEDAARALLAESERGGRADLLERLLREYPNALVVPEALLRRAERLLADGATERAVASARALLADHPHDERAAAAAALLARGYAALGRSGAARFALGWLSERHGATEFDWEGRRQNGHAVAAAEGYSPGGPTGPPPEEPGTAPPLREVHVETVSEDAWGRQVEVATERGPSGRAPPAPVALLGDQHNLVGFDLQQARVAFRLQPGPCHRAAFADGILVLALNGALSAVGASDGAARWEAPIPGQVIHLSVARGVVFALVQDTSAVEQPRRLFALDLTTGIPVWNTALDRADYRSADPHGPWLLVRQSRYEGGRVWPALVVLDGLTGVPHHVISLPSYSYLVREPEVVGDRIVVAYRDDDGGHHVSGHAIEDGRAVWSRRLPGRDRACALVPDGSHVVILQADGHLGTYDARSGEPVLETRIFAGPSVTACPQQGTDLLLDGTGILLMPYVGRSPYVVGRWDRGSGKIDWESRWSSEGRLTRAALGRTRGLAVALSAYGQAGVGAHVLLRVVDARDGRLVQEIEPRGLAAEHAHLSLAAGWGTVVVFGRAAAAMYAPERP